MTRDSYIEHGDSGLLLGAREMQWFFDHYEPDPARREDPEISPLRAASLRGVPPAIVVAAGYDPLYDEVIAYASQDETIHAGEFFGSGTVGNCCGLEIGRFLDSGDTIELRVDRIGALTNRVERQSAT